MEAYHYQKRIAHILLVERRNVILQAPTGAGKTHAAMLPFLNALERKRDFPQRCLYSVPMRVLANQFKQEYEEAVKKAGRDDRLRVTIQTGDHQEDREFTGNLIFATIDQTLSSFLVSPYSLSRGRANLNAGAVMSSYLVFDEFHLFDPISTLPTTLHMLQMLQGITPFILMTATFSQDMLEGLAQQLKAVVVGGTDEEREAFQQLPSQNKERFYHASTQPLSADAVLDRHKGRTLVICNTVDRARGLFEAIREKASGKVLLLHSRLLPEHRNETEDTIRSVFGKDGHGGDYIVVSTQAIEVGVDMTSTALHTELAPANAILQRAGRCARYEDETGDVFVYRQTFDNGEEVDLLENINPYQGQSDEFARTWEALCDRDGAKLTFADEQEIVSLVHGERDRRILRELDEQNYEHRRRMYAVMRGDERDDARALIRDINQQQVTIHDNPDEMLDNPFAYPSFGLYPGTLQGYIKRWLERAAEDDSEEWAVMYLREEPDDEQANKRVYRWLPVDRPETAKYVPLIVVHPRLATYDPILGFLADRGGDWVATRNAQAERTGPDRHYRLETYEEHIAQVYRAFKELWPEARWVASRLEKHFDWPQGSVTRAAQLAVLLHDVGKLSRGWQAWAQEYQKMLAQIMDEEVYLPAMGAAYAHTTYDSRNEYHQQAEKLARRKRPWHAVEGAVATLGVLMDELQNEILSRAAYSAIARHHAPYSSEHRDYQLIRDAAQHVVATFSGQLPVPDLSSLYGVEEKVSKDSNAGDYLIQPEDQELGGFLTYLLIVRALRRADSLGTQRGTIG